ncbi:hypothetical protein [Thermoactinomyces sp. DSM 45892]|uniref:hypothetical protein n=1 Tax=Thermoactinomyces sp. DSM 45892 TaxID=1882753 RepID=UPI00089978C1|nr:hypothetical protein [Thermoactinomyces sp. DSM 45892]SDX95410.1 hypothetical protein SAMN05444416_10193 [Thermoactinomyces sp. DSM 45892]
MQNELIKLGVDLAQGKVKHYSSDEANSTLRQAFLDLMEVSDNGKIDRKTFRRHKTEVFEILEVILEEVVNESIENQFSDLAEYRNLKWGDANEFIVPDNELFRVAIVSDGNGNIRRQRLRDGEEFMVSLDTYAVKIYEEFHRFLAGRMDWVAMINKVAQSYLLDLNQKIYDALYSAYGKYNSTYHKTLAGLNSTQMEDELVQLAMHIEAVTGEKVAVYGSKMALRKFAPSAISENMKDARNKIGFYGEIAGIELRELKQSHRFGTDEFSIDNNFILMLPQNADRMIKIVNEGEAIIQETEGGKHADMSLEYLIAQRFGVGVICSKVFGFIKLQ